MRPRALPAPIRRSISAGSTPASAALAAITPGVFSVRVRPGCTTVTLMPDRPNSSARFLVSAATPTLRTEPTADPVLRAPSPDTLMMRPHPCATMCGAASRAQRRYPITLTLTSSQNSSVVISASLGGAAWPMGLAALLTRMSKPPSSATQRCTKATTEASSPVSAAMATTLRPLAAASSAAVAASAWASRPAMATSHPSAANARAIALPIPRVPPVTNARLPFSCRSIGAAWHAARPRPYNPRLDFRRANSEW